MTSLNNSSEILLGPPNLFRISTFIDPWVHVKVWSDESLSLTIRLENLSEVKQSSVKLKDLVLQFWFSENNQIWSDDAQSWVKLTQPDILSFNLNIEELTHNGITKNKAQNDIMLLPLQLTTYKVSFTSSSRRQLAQVYDDCFEFPFSCALTPDKFQMLLALKELEAKRET